MLLLLFRELMLVVKTTILQVAEQKIINMFKSKVNIYKWTVKNQLTSIS